MTKKIILDCDPGHDDAVAILLALGNPEIELLGVTTVGGNQMIIAGRLPRRSTLSCHTVPRRAASC